MAGEGEGRGRKLKKRPRVSDSAGFARRGGRGVSAGGLPSKSVFLDGDEEWRLCCLGAVSAGEGSKGE
jgi:hypothetical protein